MYNPNQQKHSVYDESPAFVSMPIKIQIHPLK